jgi:hypothetical protein
MKNEAFIVDYLYKDSEPTFIIQIKFNIFQGSLNLEKMFLELFITELNHDLQSAGKHRNV